MSDRVLWISIGVLLIVLSLLFVVAFLGGSAEGSMLQQETATSTLTAVATATVTTVLTPTVEITPTAVLTPTAIVTPTFSPTSTLGPCVCPTSTIMATQTPRIVVVTATPEPTQISEVYLPFVTMGPALPYEVRLALIGVYVPRWP